MIYVERGPEPVGFAARAAAWQRRFVEAQTQNPKLTPGQFWSQIRREIQDDAQALVEVFQGKCAFCESKMGHVSAPHIEHYRPKSKFDDRMFVWQNWLLSCGRCNDTKWAHFPDCHGQPCLIDPTLETPSEYLDFLEAQVLYKTERGQKTIKLVGLDRSLLAEERAWWLMTIQFLLLLVFTPQTYPEARQLLIWAMQPNAPYTAMTRAYLQRKAPRLANPPTPHLWIELPNPMKQITELIEKYRHQLHGLE